MKSRITGKRVEASNAASRCDDIGELSIDASSRSYCVSDDAKRVAR